MRRNNAFTIALAAATAFIATPALAQGEGLDLDTTFNGLYIGAGGGYDMQSNDSSSSVVFDTDRNGSYNDTVLVGGVAGTNAFSPGFCSGYSQSPNKADGCAGDKDRGEYFGRVGLDKRYGHFVAGIVLEGGKTDVNDRTTAFSSTPQSYAFSRGIDWYGAARLRAGFTPNGGILFYGTGGGIYANMDHGFRTTNTTATFTQNGNDDAWGYQYGGGIEAMITKHISLGMEYLYTDVKDKNYSVTAVGGAFGTGTDMRPADQRLNYHAVRGTVNFRF